jgi:hypothetical protein
MLAFVAMLVLTLAAVGWYLDWYRIRGTPAPDGHRSVTVDLNTHKIGEDLHKAEQQIQQKLAEKAKQGSGEILPEKKPLSVPAPAKGDDRDER